MSVFVCAQRKQCRTKWWCMFNLWRWGRLDLLWHMSLHISFFMHIEGNQIDFLLHFLEKGLFMFPETVLLVYIFYLMIYIIIVNSFLLNCRGCPRVVGCVHIVNANTAGWGKRVRYLSHAPNAKRNVSFSWSPFSSFCETKRGSGVVNLPNWLVDSSPPNLNNKISWCSWNSTSHAFIVHSGCLKLYEKDFSEEFLDLGRTKSYCGPGCREVCILAVIFVSMM